MIRVQRTTQQIEADDALTAAIEDVLRAYAPEPSVMERYMLAEYMVVIAHHGLRDGEEVTMSNVIFKDSDVPITRALGLARYGSLFMDRMMMTPDE